MKFRSVVALSCVAISSAYYVTPPTRLFSYSMGSKGGNEPLKQVKSLLKLLLSSK
jgi:hypothetical protein